MVFQSDSARKIAEWIGRGMLDPAEIADSLTLSTFPGRDMLHVDLLAMLHGMAQFGREQLNAELARQGVVQKNT